MTRKCLQAIFLISIMFIIGSCKEEKPTDIQNTVRPDDDARIGRVIDDLFLSQADTNSDLTILNRTDFWKLYNFADSMVLRMLNTGEFQYTNEFNWKVRVFEQGGVEKAFAAPGGYVYLSKDLLLFLENEADFAGVLAYTMMVSDGRFITKSLQNHFSISYLLDIALGAAPTSPNELMNAVANVTFSEEDAQGIDNMMRKVICHTEYDIRSFSSFISRAKYNTTNAIQMIEWLDMYPCPAGWADDVYNTYNTSTCSGETTNQIDYEKIKLTIGK